MTRAAVERNAILAATCEPRDALLPEECERLWDAFETVEHFAYKAALDSYLPAKTRAKLRMACEHYREVRDSIEAARVLRAAGLEVRR